MIAQAYCHCTRVVRVVLIAALVEFVTFPIVHTIWERGPILSGLYGLLGL